MKTQKTTSDIEFLDRLSFDNSMKVNSIEDEAIRAEVISAIQEIPFVFNLVKKDRKKLSEYKRWDNPYDLEDRVEDPKGKIEVDVTQPHVLEDMDYFRERAIYFQEHGVYCNITPNRYPGSRYMRFWREEQRRCRDGYVRESDGEWITGYHYWYLNYCPIQVTEKKGNKKRKAGSGKKRKADRKRDFPRFWDSDYLWFHYLERAEENGNHAVNLKTRGRGYSYKGGSTLSRNYYHFKGSNSVAIASSLEYLLGDGILNKTWDVLNFIDNNTPWRKSRDFENTKMHKKASYKDPKTKTEKGILSEVMGVTTGGDPERARGKRAKVVLFEEAGKFPHLKTALGIARPSVEQGNDVFGLLIAWGTGGCVCAGTKVWTANGGLKNVEDLTKEDGTIGFDGKSWSIEDIPWMQPATEKECVRITTNTRRTLDCSIDHPILKGIQPHKKAGNIKGNEFVDACELQVGDRIATIKEVGVFGDKRMWEPRVVGWLIGDGSYLGTPRLSNCEQEINDYMDSKFEGSVSESYVTKTGKNYRTKSIRGIVSNLKELGIHGQSKFNKTLPTDIHSYSKQDICELLGGIFDTDGYVAIRTNKKRNTPIAEVSLSSMSESLLNEVRLLLQKLGIHGTMRERLPRKKKEGIQDKNPWYEFTISSKDSLLGFYENINLFPKVKQERLDEIGRVYSQRVGHMKHEGIIYESVVSIENIGIKPIYNFTAGNTNTYIANGIITHNTASSDFDGIRDSFYSPETFNMLGIPNVFDRKAGVGNECGYYCGEYMNREGCYDKDGNSDVVSALIETFVAREIIKKSSQDPNALIQEKADRSITPQEACMRKEGSLFNIEDLKIHAAEVDTNPKKYTDATWKVKMYFSDGKVKWKISDRDPVRQYPIVENKGLEGCVEIFEHPIVSEGQIHSNIYWAGIDPYDDDNAGGPSLGSIQIGNILTRRIVAEYTGRPQTAEEFYEICYRLMKYYNARANYENNKKGMFQYFDRINATYMLADTPSILKDMQITKKVGFGNTAKGTNATKAVNNWGNSLIRSWLMEQAYNKEEGVRNYTTLISPGMLKELIAYDPEVGNYDRIAALRMLLIMFADREKYGITDKEAHDTEDPRMPVDQFFLKHRKSMNNRFKAEATEDNLDIKRRFRR